MGREVVCIDTPVLIYWLERNPEFFARALRVMEQIEKGTLTGVTSVICLAEVLVKPHMDGDRVLAGFLDDIVTNFPNLAVLLVDAGTARLAAELRGEYNLKLPDAIVAATALISNCTRLVTNDPALQRIEPRGVRVEVMG